MKQFAFLTTALLASAVFFFAFSPAPGLRISAEDVPGEISAIGDAGSPNKFTFERWEFTKAEMTDDKVENIHLEAEIDCTSLQCDWKDLLKSVKKKKDYFYVAKYPTAKVVINGAEAQQDGTFLTEAEVTIKKYTRKVPLTFTITDEKPYQVVGDGLLKRKKFGFTGGGPEAKVPVHFEAQLPFE